MPALIREYRPDDEEPVVQLSLRAWAPVFGSLQEVMGREIFGRLVGDWQKYQQAKADYKPVPVTRYFKAL